MKILLNLNQNLNNYSKTRKAPNKEVSFKGFDCSEMDFEIKGIYDIPCPSCGVTLIQRNQIDNFVSEAQVKKGEELANLFIKYQKYFHKTESKAADIIIFEARKNPNKNLSELTRNYLNSLRAQSAQEQLDLIERIKKLAYDLTPQTRKATNEILEKYENNIQFDKTFDKTSFLKELERVLSKSSSTGKKILKTAQKMPEVEDDEIKFLEKYASKTQAELASRFVSPSFATTEHIVPKSLGGKNNTENYLAECEECNSTRNNVPFFDWIKNSTSPFRNFKTFKDNFSNYIAVVASKINSGEISEKYRDYPKDAIETIAKETNGAVNILAPESTFLGKDNEETELNQEKRIEALQKSISSSKAKLEELRALDKKAQGDEQILLLAKDSELKNSLTKIESQIQEQKAEVSSLKTKLDKYDKKVRLLEKKKEDFMLLVLKNKDTEELKSQIDKIQFSLDLTDPSALIASLNEAQEALSHLQAKRTSLMTEYNKNQEKIITKKKAETRISSLKEELQELQAYELEIEKLEAFFQKNENVEAEIKEKEERIESLLEENKVLELKGGKKEEISFYQDLTAVILKAQKEEASFLNADKKETTSILMRKLASKKAQELIQQMAKENGFIQEQINLEEISKLSKEIAELKISKQKLEEANSKLQELVFEISQYPNKEELEVEIDILEEELLRIKERQNLIGIKDRIRALEEDIRLKEEFIQELQTGTKSTINLEG